MLLIIMILRTMPTITHKVDILSDIIKSTVDVKSEQHIDNNT